MPELNYQVCISDNCSTDNTEKVVKRYKDKLNIKYSKNKTNSGRTQNYLNVVDMADGEFIWLLGDDDLLYSYAINDLALLLIEHQSCDFFYINASHLTTEYVLSFNQPFDISNLPNDMQPFSLKKQNEEIPFLKLIDPHVSFDFLGGMFLSVFRRKNWLDNVNVLNRDAINDLREFSYYDNTFPHVKIFSKAFSESKAYFYSKPLSVCLTGAREWAPMYPFVRSVRLIQSLDEYRINGLSYFQYIYCKNASLIYFIPDLAFMLINRKKSGIEYISVIKLIINNILYPNAIFSPFYYVARKMRAFLKL
jgi:glycosyltransferase involved in cell wall biosynthesis